MKPNRYIIGVDVGQTNDPTAIAVVEHTTREPKPIYRVRGLYRYRLGTRYTEVASDITTRLSQAPFYKNCVVAIDATGVGAPVVDLIKDDPRIWEVYAITITAGTAVGGRGYQRTAPKRDLINTTAVLLQQHRLRIAATLPDTPALANELRNYRIKTSDNGHKTYGPANSQDHDDLLLALSLALWAAELRPASIAMTTPWGAETRSESNYRVERRERREERSRSYRSRNEKTRVGRMIGLFLPR
jgi:hypothetical protein